MPYLSPPTLTKAEQQALLEASSVHPRDHQIFSLALGTGLRLSEITRPLFSLTHTAPLASPR